MLRQKMKKLSLLLEISEPEEIADGVYQTTLSHPKLKGELSFVHSQAGGRDEFLKALDQNIIGQLSDVVNVVGELLDGASKRKSATTPAVGSAREK